MTNLKIAVLILLSQSWSVLLQQINHNSHLFKSYTPINNYDISVSDETGILIKSISLNTNYDCLKQCNLIKECLMISYKMNQCKLFDTIKFSISTINLNPCLFKKFNPNYDGINSYLTNYWPLNSNFNDVISRANVIESFNAKFTKDRLNQNMSAIHLQNGYLRVPQGVYFFGDFTFSSWIKTHSYRKCAKIVDFGLATLDPYRYQNVLIAVDDCGITGRPKVAIMNNGNYLPQTTSNTSLRIKKWDHFAFTLAGTLASIYVNGKLVAQNQQNSPLLYTRLHNYIGKDNYSPMAPMVDMEVDDIKIFNKSLTATEINMVMNSYY